MIEFSPTAREVTATALDGTHSQPSGDLVVDRAGPHLVLRSVQHGRSRSGRRFFRRSIMRRYYGSSATSRNAWKMQARHLRHRGAARGAAVARRENALCRRRRSRARSRARVARVSDSRRRHASARTLVLQTFGADHRGVHRGIEGMCLDSDGNIVACAGSAKRGPGPLVYVFAPGGAVLEDAPLPGDVPIRCAFGDARTRQPVRDERRRLRLPRAKHGAARLQALVVQKAFATAVTENTEAGTCF